MFPARSSCQRCSPFWVIRRTNGTVYPDRWSRPGLSVLVRSAFPSEHVPDRQEYDLEVQAQTPVLHVLHIVFDPLLHLFHFLRFTAVAIDLSGARNSRIYEVSHLVLLDNSGILIELALDLRPWSNDGHATHQNVDKLRQFVQVGFPKESAYAGNARIVLGCLLFRVGVNNHGSELVAFEQFVLPAKP